MASEEIKVEHGCFGVYRRTVSKRLEIAVPHLVSDGLIEGQKLGELMDLLG